MRIFPGIIPVLLILLFISGCKKEDEPAYKIDKLSGLVQKGPYINGTAITVAELDENLDPTGKTFSTQIVDNKGSFEVNNVELVSPYVEIRADGFYFDEVKGEKSAAQLTLFGLADVSDQSTINVNILTQLEKSRVKNLMGEGLSFSESKSQAQTDVLNIFGIEYEDMSSSELLDISQEDEENAILLAISLMVQGNGSVGDLTELLANINTDIREDGVLNSIILDSMLITQARSLKASEIRKNLTDRYALLGVEALISDFEKYVGNFLPGGLNVSYTSTDVTCNGQNDGAINLSVEGGTSPYSYIWSDGETGNSISNLEPGIYSVTITDSRFYSYTINSISISEPERIEISTIHISNSGFELDNGAIDISVSGGNPPYEYTWSNNASSQDISNLSPGSYNVQVTDLNSCSSSSDFQIFEQDYITKDASCNGNNDGEIDITVRSGAPPYSFLWSNGATTEDLTGLMADSYSVTITDANNQTYEIIDIVISEPEEISIIADVSHIPLDGTVGEIDITVSGGTPPYSFTWSNGAVTEDISDLQTGAYMVEVQDANACLSSKSMAVSGYGYIVDERDGQQYKVVSIGDQTWMAENLRAIVYSNGDPLVDGKDAGNITGDYTTKYWFAYDDDIANMDRYGLLYTWAAVMNNSSATYAVPSGVQGVCPTGWHLPSAGEWDILVEYLGGGNLAAGKMIDDTYSSIPDLQTPVTNESGLSIILGGDRTEEGSFRGIGWWTDFWMSSANIPGVANHLYISILESVPHMFTDDLGLKEFGLAVRCIKD